MNSDIGRLTAGPAPHIRRFGSLALRQYGLVLALLPALVAAVLAAPLGAGVGGTAALLALGAASALLTEYLAQLAMHQRYRALDGHALLVGLLIPLLLPPTVPAWVVVIGAALAIIVGKQIYGGLGSYPFHPALVGLLIVHLSWPHHTFPIGGTTLATASDAVRYLIPAGGLVLLALGWVRWEVPLAVVLGVVVSTLALGQVSVHVGSVTKELLQGHLMLGAFFIAADPTSSPANRIPLLLYGFLAGFLVILVRAFGVWPDPVPFALMLANLVSPLLDRIRPRPIVLEGSHA